MAIKAKPAIRQRRRESGGGVVRCSTCSMATPLSVGSAAEVWGGADCSITGVRGENGELMGTSTSAQRTAVPIDAQDEPRGDIRTPHQGQLFVGIRPLGWFPDEHMRDRGAAMHLGGDQQRIIDAFVEVATTPLLAGFNDGAHAVLDVCREILGVDDGAMIDDSSGEVSTLVAASDPYLLDVFASRHTHGMKGVRECLRGAIPVSREIPREGFVIDPVVKQLSTDGFRHEHFVPMRLRGKPVGALAMFDRRVESLGPEDLILAQGIADSSAAVLEGVRSLADATLVIAQLRGALDSRIVIEQAKGIVAERLNVDLPAAFDHLRRSARSQRRPLNDLCSEVVSTRNVLDPLLVHEMVQAKEGKKSSHHGGDR